MSPDTAISLRTDAPVELRLASEPGRVLAGRLLRVSPEPTVDRRRFFRIEVEVANADLGLRPGMTGEARFDAGKAPLATHLVGSLARMFRVDVWM